MPDFAMCVGKRPGIPECPLRNSCRRFTAKAERHQSYIDPPYVIQLRDSENLHGKCDYYMVDADAFNYDDEET